MEGYLSTSRTRGQPQPSSTGSSRWTECFASLGRHKWRMGAGASRPRPPPRRCPPECRRAPPPHVGETPAVTAPVATVAEAPFALRALGARAAGAQEDVTARAASSPRRATRDRRAHMPRNGPGHPWALDQRQAPRPMHPASVGRVTSRARYLPSCCAEEMNRDQSGPVMLPLEEVVTRLQTVRAATGLTSLSQAR